jgi:hypothetical protein
MKILQIILVSILFISCKQDLDQWVINYPPEAEEAINLFKDYAPPGLKVKKLTIVLTDNLYRKGRKVNGYSSRPLKKIFLDTATNAWKHARIRLILHELGHQVLKREHEEGDVSRDWYNIEEFYKLIGAEGIEIPKMYFPKSLMNQAEYYPLDIMMKNQPVIFDYYMEELFNY